MLRMSLCFGAFTGILKTPSRQNPGTPTYGIEGFLFNYMSQGPHVRAFFQVTVDNELNAIFHKVSICLPLRLHKIILVGVLPWDIRPGEPLMC